MGILISKAIETLTNIGKNDPSKMLLLGLDGAGKTTIIYKLKLREFVHSIPTIGFNVEQIEYKNLRMTMWDIGGQKTIRKLWRHYYDDVDAVIYIVDSCDIDRIEETKEELHCLLSEEKLSDSKLLVFANKQDIAELSVAEIASKLGLYNLKNREWHIQGCSAITGEGLYEGFDWLSKLQKKKKN